MWGLARELVASRNHEELLEIISRKAKHPGEFVARVHEIYASADAESLDALELADGRVFERFSCRQLAGRRRGGRVWSFRDVTERKRNERFIKGVAAQAAVAIDNARLYEAAQKAAEERTMLLDSERAARSAAERMSEMKDLFLANLSNELRTPLNAITGWCQVLRRGPRQESDYQKGLETIERNAHAQTQLIEDLLDMSRITSGKVRLDIQPVAPASFIEAAIETVRPAADAKDIRIEKLLDPLAGPISGDPSRLQQVIWNLLSNAIKFTPNGGRVQVVLERVNSHIEIHVADTGMASSRSSLTCIRTLPAGRCVEHARLRRPGPRPYDREAPGRVARRHGARAKSG